MQPSLKLLQLFSLFFFSCVTNDQKQRSKSDTAISSVNTTQITLSQKQQKTEASIPETDTLVIDHKTAVFYQPDSLQLEKRMKQVGEEDFRAGMDDYIYYINISAEYLENQGLPVLDAKNKKYLRFVRTDGKTQLIKLDTLKELWGMYLFDPKKEPYPADIVSIEEDYKSYFQ